jgi:hypothetical protein
MHCNILPVPTGQAITDLEELAANVREAHFRVVTSLSSTVEAAISAGTYLAQAKKLTGHGRWIEFVRACDLNERTARRYMQLAELASKRSSTTDLVGKSIEGAIKYLAPPKPRTTKDKPAVKIAAASPKSAVKPANGSSPNKLSSLAWADASADERRCFIDAIGLEPLLAVIPDAWWPLLEQHIAERHPPAPTETVPVDSIPDDLSIPPFLRRPLPAKSEAVVS